MNFRVTIYLVFVVVVLAAASCHPPKTGQEDSAVCYPYDLRVDVNDQTMTVMWKTECNRLMSGYNVYISEQPLTDIYPGRDLPASVKPFNRTAFAGDTEPEDGIEYFVAEGLDNGIGYYVSARVILPDGRLSKPSNEMLVVCAPRGEIELSIRYTSDRDGYSFEQNHYVRADHVDNDIYFYSKDGSDYLASPGRLDGFLRSSRLKVLAYGGDLEQVVRRLGSTGGLPVEDRVAVKSGDWIWIHSSEGITTLVKVLDIRGQGTERMARLFFALLPGVVERESVL